MRRWVGRFFCALCLLVALAIVVSWGRSQSLVFSCLMDLWGIPYGADVRIPEQCAPATRRQLTVDFNERIPGAAVSVGVFYPHNPPIEGPSFEDPRRPAWEPRMRFLLICRESDELGLEPLLAVGGNSFWKITSGQKPMPPLGRVLS